MKQPMMTSTMMNSPTPDPSWQRMTVQDATQSHNESSNATFWYKGTVLTASELQAKNLSLFDVIFYMPTVIQTTTTFI